jgi:hypothetical protein
MVEALPDARIRYFNTGIRLSMCDNYEFALGHARGTYVIFIGDDDGVIPGALDKLIRVLRAGPLDEVYMWPLHVYDWPVRGSPATVAVFARNHAPKSLDLKRLARFVVAMGSWKHYELPSVYHCAVPIRVLNAIRARTGRVFHSTQPDVFTGMAIPAFVERATNLGHPVTLNGRSALSNGRGFVDKSAQDNIARFIREYGDYRFHPTLYSGAPAAANMIPDAVLISRDLFPELYGSTRFNYDAMWAYLCRLRFVSYRQVLRMKADIRRHHEFRAGRFLRYALLQEISVIRRKILNKAARLGFLKDPPASISEFVKKLAPESRELR